MSEGGPGEADDGSGEAPALPISIAIVTLNEETNLPRLLASVRGLAAEIVIIDSGSTDRTEAIAREAGAVFVTAPWEGFVVQKNRALERCTQPWALFLDADEALSPELAASARGLFSGGRAPEGDGFWVNRRTWYLGAWIWHAWYPEWRLRLIRRGAGRWGGMDPHAKLEVRGAAKRLEGDLLHYSFRDLEDHLERTIRYSRTMANSYIKAGKRFRWRHLLLSPWVAFFKHLALKQGWRDGWRGWLISVIRAIDVFAKYAFLLEKELGERAAGRTREPDS
jgi:glycosyltransferase involved in cell wall biosynthesis